MKHATVKSGVSSSSHFLMSSWGDHMQVLSVVDLRFTVVDAIMRAILNVVKGVHGSKVFAGHNCFD